MLWCWRYRQKLMLRRKRISTTGRTFTQRGRRPSPWGIKWSDSKGRASRGWFVVTKVIKGMASVRKAETSDYFFFFFFCGDSKQVPPTTHIRIQNETVALSRQKWQYTCVKRTWSLFSGSSCSRINSESVHKKCWRRQRRVQLSGQCFHWIRTHSLHPAPVQEVTKADWWKHCSIRLHVV